MVILLLYKATRRTALGPKEGGGMKEKVQWMMRKIRKAVGMNIVDENKIKFEFNYKGKIKIDTIKINFFNLAKKQTTHISILH